MYVLMQCVAEAVVAKGVRGLAELVPGGAFLYDVANEAHKRLRDRKRADQIREEVVAVAAAGIEEVKKVAEQVVAEVAKNATPSEKAALEMYLTQVPGAVRASLRRAEDPSGKSVPDQFALADGNDLARRLPSRLPKFRPGDPLPGRPGWVVGELLGSGGFGEVWLARNPALAALKGAVKFGTDPQARERLLRHEGGLVSRVMEEGRHPNIVPLLDAYLDGDTPWLMYEYVSGGELGTLIGAWQALAPADRTARTATSLRTLAAAVGHFHRLSPPLVHRDLKPANILVRGTPAAPQLLVADFGIGGVAADAALAAETSRRSSGYLGSQLWGSHTPLYASPQQQRGEKPDPRDDVHALGVIGYQMLTGKLDTAPGADFARTLRRLNVPEPLIELLGDCAAHDPAHRPKDATELADRLARLDTPGGAAAAPPTEAPQIVGCPTCGVSLRFRAGATALRCVKCGTVFNPTAAAAPPPVPVVEAQVAPTTRRAEPVTRRGRDDDDRERDRARRRREEDERERDRRRERDRERDRRPARDEADDGKRKQLWFIVGGGVAAAVFLLVLFVLVRGRSPVASNPTTGPGGLNPGPAGPSGVSGTPGFVPGTPGTQGGVTKAPPRADLIKHVSTFTHPAAGTAALIRFAPDGKSLLAVNPKGAATVLSTDGKKLLDFDTTVPGFRPAFFPDGQMLAAAAPAPDGKHTPYVIPLRGGIAEAVGLTGFEEKVTAVAVDELGSWVVAGGEGGAVRVWNARSPKSAYTLKVGGGEAPHPRAVAAMTFTADGKYLVTAGGGVVRAWAVSPQWTGENMKATYEGEAFDAALTADGKKLAVGTKGRGLVVWDFPALTAPGVSPADGPLTAGGGFTRVAVGERHFLALNAAGKYGLWTGAGTNPLAGGHMTDTAAFKTVTADVAFALDSDARGVRRPGSNVNVFAAGNDDGTVLIWHLFHGMPVVKLTNHGGPVVGVAFTPDGKTLATADRTGRVRVWGDVNIGPGVSVTEIAAP